MNSLVTRYLNLVHYRMNSLKRFHNVHEGSRCFIIGNGPSLNSMDLNKLKDEHVFVTNSFFLMFPKISWRPAYYTCVDTRVLPDRRDDILKMHHDNRSMKLFFPQLLINHMDQSVRHTSKVIPPGENRFFFRQIPPSNDNLPFSAFSLDAGKVVIQPYSVTITALQLAYYMGFNPIYLIGCDTDYKVPETVIKERELFLTSTHDDDDNHFCRDYFGKGRQWHEPQVEKMIWHYEMARDAVARSGRQIYNATVGGKLEVFPRVDYDELF